MRIQTSQPRLDQTVYPWVRPEISFIHRKAFFNKNDQNIIITLLYKVCKCNVCTFFYYVEKYCLNNPVIIINPIYQFSIHFINLKKLYIYVFNVTQIISSGRN